MREAVIVAYGRSPICRARKGGLSGTHPVDYGAQVLKGVLSKVPALKPEEIEDVIVGCAVPHDRVAMNVAKNIVARAELPTSVAGHSINRFCSSGLQAIATAASGIIANQGDVVIAGGIEDMTGTFTPYEERFMNKWLLENDEGAYMAMGITAENVAAQYDISREEMEEAAVHSHRKAYEAQLKGKLDPSIIPITVLDGDGNGVVLTRDEGIRPGTSMESLAEMKPCFLEDGKVTAATSSQTSDGAAFAILMEAEKAKSLGIKPIAKLVSYAVAGCDSKIMGIGPIYAVPKAMERAKLSLKDMDVIELNEAFASQMLECIKVLEMDPEKVNPYGGAMALGHPMGATGVFLTCKALDYLKDNDKKYALVTMCIGGGMGAAGVFERL